MAAPAFTTLLLERRDDGVGVLRLNRPRALNALDAETLGELAAAAEALASDAGMRAVVVTGAGEKAFSAGADIPAMAAMARGDGHGYARLGHAAMTAIESLEVPVVAAVNGHALGGGLELALACDLLVVSERARLGQPEITLGLIPGFGGTQRLVRRIGQARARELIYSGRQIGAAEALAIGLATRVVAPEQVLAEALALAAELAAKPALALRQAKRATRIAADADAVTGLAYEVEAFAVTFASDDRVEGLRAFLEKRPPAWKGR
jgi:cyclohexa-1,5-dienecarbonyl-CoA hydratase